MEMKEEIPYGKCSCGCGGDTTIAKKNQQRCGNIKGQPQKFIFGHRSRLPFIRKKSIEQRFWDKVNIRGECECWEWTGYRRRNGYGQTQYGNKIQGAHRVAFILSGGVLTQEKSYVLHRCDNPPCCNPKHLFAGNQEDNNKDRNAKGRSANNKGNKNPSAKLGEEQIREIRGKYKNDNISYEGIGMLYGISKAHVMRICRHISWAHIQ